MLTKEQFYEVAKIIDNEFIDSFKTFSCDRSLDKYNLLVTNKCDWASSIIVYSDYKSILDITRCGDDTHGYERLHKTTICNINKYLNSVGVKSSLL